jgi:tetratricopeptide (TPR) repeat protein
MSDYFRRNPEILASSTNIIVVILVFLTFLLPVLGPGLILVDWGFNQIDYLPSALYYLWLLLALAAIIHLFMTPKAHFISDSLSPYLWGDKKAIGRTVLIVLALLLFILLRFDAHLYGNGYIRAGNFAQKTRPIFLWHEFGGTLIPYVLYQLIQSLGVAKVAASLWAYRIVSILSGGAFLYFLFMIAENIGNDDRKSLAFFLLIFFSGLTVFFFGMVENVPILLPAIAALIYLIIKLNQERKLKFALYVWIVSIAGVILDLQFITVLPTVLYLSCKHLIRLERIGKFLGSLAALAAILFAVATVYLAAMGNMSLSDRILFLSGKSPDTAYWLFSGRHLADIFNLLFLFAPLFAVFIFAVIRGFGKLRRDPNFKALGLLTVSQIIYLFVIDPKNGMAREINMYAFLLGGFVFFSAHLLTGLCPALFVLILPVFYVHLSPTATEKYIDDYLKYNETKYESALYAFRDYYIIKGEYNEAVSRERAITSLVPGALESQLVSDLYSHNRADEALDYALRLVERFPYNATYRMQKGNLLKHYKRYEDAEKELMTAIELDPYRPELYHFLAELCRETGEDAKAYRILEKGLNIDPASTTILVDLIGFYFRTRQPRIVDSLTDVVIAIDSAEPYAYMYKGLLAEKVGFFELALRYYDKFYKMNDKLPEIPLILKKINSLQLKMKDTTDQSE